MIIKSDGGIPYMMRLLFNLTNKIRAFMIGRYGNDELSRFLVFLSLGLMVLSFVPYLRILYIFALIALVFSYYRILSKDYAKRTMERNRYFIIKNKFISKINIYKSIIKDRKTHKYFKCKKCKQYTRVPRGVGKIELTCRVCKTKMTKKA